MFGAAADPTLLARLDLKPGARVTVGNAAIEIRAALTSEPDKLAGGIGFGPRLLISEDGVARHRAGAARQPGALASTGCGCRQATPATPRRRPSPRRRASNLPEAGWEIRTRTNASPQLERNVERFTQFLTLVGLTALLVGGVGVANAVKSHLDRKRDVIATMKALGATRRARLRDLSDAGDAAGADRRRRSALALGAALPFVISWTLRRDHSAAAWRRACIRPSLCWRCSMAC